MNVASRCPLRHFVQHLDPVPGRPAGSEVEARMQAVEHQVPHVDDVGLLEHDDRVTARVPGAVVERPDLFVAERRRPAFAERDVGVGLRRGIGGRRRRLLVPLQAFLLADDVLHGGLEDRVAAGVIAVVVRVDQEFDPFRRLLLQALDARPGGGGKLTVDGNRAVPCDDLADRAALAREVAHARRISLNAVRPARQAAAPRPAAGRGRPLRGRMKRIREIDDGSSTAPVR